MKNIFLIAKVTFKESIREKVLHGLLVVFALISLFSFALGQLSFAEQVRLGLDFGLSVMHLSLVGISLFLGSHLIHREIERKTIFTLLVKPLRRHQYVLGKFIGLSFLLAVTGFICAVFLLLSMRAFGRFYFAEIFQAAFGQWLESCFLVALVLFLGQLLKPTVTIFCGVSLFLIGHWFETLHFFIKKNPEGGLALLYSVLSFVFPNLEKWNWKSSVIYGEFVPYSHLAISFVEAGFWCIFYLSLSAFLFQRRDLVS